MKLLGAVPSPYFRKCRMVLEEKGIAYTPELLSPFPKRPALFEASPLGKIPVLVDGDLSLPDSSAICAYLERCQPSPALYPSDPANLGRALFLEEYADTQLADALLGVQVERFLKPRVLNQPTDEARLKQLMEHDVPREFDFVESRVPASGWLLDDFSIADIAVIAQLGVTTIAKFTIDDARWPRLASYHARAQERPSVKAAFVRFEN
jgi:glutathione S-transferase